MRETEDEEEETEQNRMISPDSRDMGGKRDMYHKPFVLDWFCIVDTCLLGYKNRSDNRAHQ